MELAQQKGSKNVVFAPTSSVYNRRANFPKKEATIMVAYHLSDKITLPEI